jgi:hypothetical protein
MLLSSPAEPHADQRRQHADRHDQHDRQRQHPALVLGRERQEDEQHRQREDVHRHVVAACRSWKASSVHSNEVPAGNVSAASFCMVSRAAPLDVPGAAFALHRHRGVHVVALHQRRAGDTSRISTRVPSGTSAPVAERTFRRRMSSRSCRYCSSACARTW